MDVKRAILWDLDGTIVDTKASHFFTWRHALKKFGFKLEQDVFNSNFGRNNNTLLPLYLGFQPDADLKAEIINEKESLFRKLALQQVSLMPGVKNWLDKADQLNFGQAIASSAPMENISLFLDNFDLSHHFASIVSGENLPAKPKPDIFIIAAKKLGCLPEDCLVIEDSLAGIRAAKDAGMQCIALSTTHPRQSLNLADLVMDDFRGSIDDALRELY